MNFLTNQMSKDISRVAIFVTKIIVDNYKIDNLIIIIIVGI
jgi:hypothetical protein